MAEALCGPSNALQNFQKHTSVDRTLQQDRNVSRRQNDQGFRSAGSASGALDAEFHAFQAPQLPSVPLQRAQLPLAHVTRYATPPLQVLPDWASDFQKLNVGETRDSTGAAGLQRASNPAGWHTEFMGNASPALQQASAMPMAQNQWQPQYQGFNPYMEDTMYGAPLQQMQPGQVMQAEPQFDDAAFARAFDQAKEELDHTSEGKGKNKAAQPEEFHMDFACTDPGDVMGEYDFDATQLGLSSEAQRPVNSLDQKITEDSVERELRADAEQLPRIGADTIIPKAESEAINPQKEADELSRTAGHLLETLKDEKNSKFQQSSFLALMRQLRDKEVKVDGDKMVPVTQSSTSDTHPGGRFYPYDAFDRPPLNGGGGSNDKGPPIQHYYADP